MNVRIQPPKILVTHPIHDEVRARLESVGRVEMNPASEPWTRAEIATRIRDADAMMGFMTDQVDTALLAEAPRLGIIACALKGSDNYNVAACADAGVWLSIVPDLLTEPTAELAVGLAIALARHVLAGDALVRRGEHRGWRPQLFGSGLANAEVTVIGLGEVGQAIIARLAGFGCARIHGVDPQPRMSELQALSLEEAMARSDYVFAAAPLAPQSLHLLNAKILAHSKQGQFIINVGRGSVVEESAIADALDSGRLAGYAADVFECEDWALPNRPRDVPERLRHSSKTLLTPHLGSAVQAVRLAIENRAADNIIAVLQGQAPGDAINQPRVSSRPQGVSHIT